MQVIQTILGFLPLLVILAVLVSWQHSRAEEILQRWTQAAGVTLVSAQKRYFRTGPVHRSGTQFVFRIVVRDQVGAERAGWLRVGGWMAGVLSDKAEVIWDS